MSDETSPAVKLRANVVLLVVGTICVLAVGAQIELGLLLAYGKAVPTELWVQAGAGITALTALLVNTKHEPTAADPAPVQVVNQADQPVPVDQAPAELPGEDEPSAEPLDEPEPPQRRRR